MTWNYVASAVRRQEHPSGAPAIYFLWAAVVLVGFSLPDFAPHAAGPCWFIAGITGGLLSWWLGARAGRKAGINDKDLGWRYGAHWMIAGFGFLLAGLPLIVGQVSIVAGTSSFLLVGGLVYALAGVHLERPLLWSGLLMLAAYVVLVIFQPPYVWTITGATIALSLAWAGWAATRRETKATR
jgi:hypothetical protein